MKAYGGCQAQKSTKNKKVVYPTQAQYVKASEAIQVEFICMN